MARPCFLIVNPTSGSYSKQRIDSVTARLKEAGLVAELLQTTKAEDGPAFAARICRTESEPIIIAGGGDGTINGVVNGLEPGKATLGILPLGTANVLAHELGLASLDAAVEAVITGRSRRISVGMLQDAVSSRYFLLMAGAGFDGAVVEGVRTYEKRSLGKGAYVMSALRVLANREQLPFSVVIDGEEIGCHCAVICNGAKYGGNFILAPGTDIFTPGFQVVLVTARPVLNYLKVVSALARRTVPTGEGISYRMGREILVNGDIAVQVDGDFHGRGPVRITPVDNFAQIFC